ncbi:flagellar motor switch protein [Hoeflea sp. IMCC20628]|uniref:FliM/FliN family flagellar motor switch protein n=1 Tax=Hoeflea sp. IMCC20628 TaxID=1620421 RepID=UPI00063ADE5F|nr:FliM/FliN family flagellar motor switch protein [Hoeflea sp. IMCC20628]AKI02166.1 flagellar motor switch protein [Hoeflea sp. IMCC20628]
MSTATETEPTSALAAFDPGLLDRMTGTKGDPSDIEVKCNTLLSVLCPLLSAALEKVTGVEIDVRPGAIRQGRRRELLSQVGTEAVYCEASIAGWSADIPVLCGSKLIIGLVECLLGGSDPADLDIIARPLSNIELDMSLVVFEQLNENLRKLVSADPKAKTSLTKPRSELPVEDGDPVPDYHAAAMTLDIGFGAVMTSLTLLLPQSLLLKSTIRHARVGEKADANNNSWSERLSHRVSRSEINLQATVALEPLQLGDISRLQTGDLIAFADKGDIEVTLSANGRPLYTCALGKAGARYMVKVEGQAGPDENWKTDFV